MTKVYNGYIINVLTGGVNLNLTEMYESIKEAKISAQRNYEIQSISIGEALEYATEKVIKRYVALLDYKKTLLFKESIKNGLKIDNLDPLDEEEFSRIENLIKEFPEKYHKCIGCPCNENDYPKCEECVFFEMCISGESVYPGECVEGDCYEFFEYCEKAQQEKV